MKSCIITFQSANNYGAVLQAYALQEYLNRNFGETKILDYHNRNIDKSYARPGIKDLFHNPKRTVFRFSQSVLYKGKSKRIEQFRADCFKLTKRYDADNIKEANSEADVFITGSDQVWNHLIIGDDTNYFLDFTAPDKKTCSFAASIGVKRIPEEYAALYKKAITHIGRISVRESSGIKALEEIGVNGAELNPDPTVLISEEQWKKLSVVPKLNKKYILVYKITKADKLLSFAKNLSKLTGYPIIYIPNDLKSGVVGSLKLGVGPREWLGYIQNAEYVVTNSFHGTMFSILFGTKFFSEVSGKVNPSASRLLTLLHMFGLEERILDRFDKNLLEKELPREQIRSICAEQQEKVHQFFEKVYYGEE